MTDKPLITRAQWIAALRSGEYKQGVNALRTSEGNYCCLGVACIVALGEIPELHYNNGGVVHFSKSDIPTTAHLEIYTETLPIFEALALTPLLEDILSRMNDGGSSFAEIADYLEALP